MSDIRFAVRRLRRHAGLCGAVVLTLGLGIGTTATIFSLVDAALLRPLPWPDAERLVAVYSVSPAERSNPAFSSNWNRGAISWPAWKALERSTPFEAVGVWQPSRWTLGYPATDTVVVWYVSTSLLTILGAEPALGRIFTAEEDGHGSADAVILTHETWQRRFGGRPDVLGHPVTLQIVPGEGISPVVVGVLPRGFRFPDEAPEFLLPIGLRASGALYYDATLRALGQLRRDESVASASGAATVVGQYSRDPRGRTSRVVPLREALTDHSAPAWWILLTASGLVLLIACANVSGLLLGDMVAREREIAVRTALGGSRWRILRQFTLEYLVYVILSAAAGFVLAIWLTPALSAVTPAHLITSSEVFVGGRVAAAAFCLALAALTLFGFAPMTALVRFRIARSLVPGGAAGARPRVAWHRTIVSAEISLSFILIVSATFFAETLRLMTSDPMGFEPRGLLVASIRVTATPEFSPVPDDILARDPFRLPVHSTWQHSAGLLERLRAVPGVLDAAGVATAPFMGGWRTIRVRAFDSPATEARTVQLQTVTQGYFSTVGLPVLRGRALDSVDREASTHRERRAVISKALERRAFGENGVGRRLVRDFEDEEPFVYEVVGVVEDAKQRQLSEEGVETLYVLDRTYSGIRDVLVRTSGEPASSASAVREAIRQYDSSILVSSVTPMETLVSESIAAERFRSALSMIFGTMALLLSGVGLYGVMARQVANRHREIAVRVAVGASSRAIRALLLREAWLVIGAALTIGLPMAWIATRLLAASFFGVEPGSGRVLLISAVLLSCVALSASLVPVWRGATLSPAEALRD